MVAFLKKIEYNWEAEVGREQFWFIGRIFWVPNTSLNFLHVIYLEGIIVFCFLIYYLVFILPHWDTIQQSLKGFSLAGLLTVARRTAVLQNLAYICSNYLDSKGVKKQWASRLNSTFRKHWFLVLKARRKGSRDEFFKN